VSRLCFACEPPCLIPNPAPRRPLLCSGPKRSLAISTCSQVPSYKQVNESIRKKRAGRDRGQKKPKRARIATLRGRRCGSTNRGSTSRSRSAHCGASAAHCRASAAGERDPPAGCSTCRCWSRHGNSTLLCAAVTRSSVVWIIGIRASPPAAPAREEQASQEHSHQNGNPGFCEHEALRGQATCGANQPA